MGRPPLPDELRGRAISLLAAGNSPTKVAGLVGVSRSKVYAWAAEVESWRMAEPANAAAAKTGCMVALYPPPAIARALALDPEEVPSAEPVEQLHLTLAFLGLAADLVGESDRLKRLVAGFAALMPPVAAEISGVGRFAAGDKVVYASVDAANLPGFRQRLIETLELAGFEPSRLHGFTPHITLAKPEGTLELTVEPQVFVFDAVTLSIAGERFDFPLEGAAAKLADPKAPDPAPRTPQRKVKRTTTTVVEEVPIGQPAPKSWEATGPTVDNEAALAGSPVPDTDEEAARRAAVDSSAKGDVNLAQGAHPQVEANVPSDLERPEPELGAVDHTYLNGIRRYVNLISNQVSHAHALAAVQHIDPRFNVPEEDAVRIMEAIGRNPGWVKLAERDPLHPVVMATIAPPSYVTSVYDEYVMGPSEEAVLAANLNEMAAQAYLEGLNQQLARLGRPPMASIGDPTILRGIQAQTAERAAGIADTYNNALASAVYSKYIDLASTLGRQTSRTILADEIEAWATNRQDWKSVQIALTEVNRWATRGASDFAAFNSHLGWSGSVEPDGCECSGCAELVDMGEVEGADLEMIEMMLPLHPNCVHEVQYTVTAEPGQQGDLWMAEDPAAWSEQMQTAMAEQRAAAKSDWEEIRDAVRGFGGIKMLDPEGNYAQSYLDFRGSGIPPHLFSKAGKLSLDDIAQFLGYEGDSELVGDIVNRWENYTRWGLQLGSPPPIPVYEPPPPPAWATQAVS